METVSYVELKQVIVDQIEYGDVRLASTDEVSNFTRDFIGSNDRETLIVIGVNTKSAINFISTVSVGSLNATIATPREVFKNAILSNSARLFLAHNHPSYDVTPSETDIYFTRVIQKCGELLGIELVDHLIVSPTEYFSFLKEGYLNKGGVIHE
ncbi:JAB domain-containing protein [Fundicoccus culcitae]|uniref:JAB domain-containing protein n=1 Tax=Fundicoccus culcitae TaxID=2969821 RepID=A0ABY5P3W6_9LACT|nr:JAB domain-containing protein [Fundicoccus culcitae]UUX33271.1 JAB domain-containing protein [Fundicoccus culcitae]